MDELAGRESGNKKARIGHEFLTPFIYLEESEILNARMTFLAPALLWPAVIGCKNKLLSSYRWIRTPWSHVNNCELQYHMMISEEIGKLN